ncbi:MAG: glycosyltransferase family 39 protein [Candidatus Nitrosopelagicus sp.]|nr:glycosyltransferase family 39 protein [Candidatus Nitrosopelagicus sp.]
MNNSSSLKKSNIATIVICLIVISSISIGFKLSHVDFSNPIIGEDTYVYVLGAFSVINGDFSQPDRKALGWSIFMSPFYLLTDSTDLLDYLNITRILSLAISTVTIIPMYILARRFFDEKYSLMASCLFAFEPHLNYNSVLGLSEPLFIFGIVLASIFILQKNHNWYFYLSFLLAGIVWWVRFNGLVMVMILSIVFFVVYKPSSKNFLKYLVCIGLFLIIVSPILIQRYDQFGDPLYFAVSDNHFIGDAYSNYAVNTKDIEYSASDYIQNNGVISFVERFGLTGLHIMALDMFKMLFPYLIFLLPFGVLFSIRSFAQDKDYIKSIWILLLVNLGSLILVFSIWGDMRFMYHVFPFIIIISTIVIQRVVKYGLSTFQFSEKQKNFFLVGVISIVIISASIFTLRMNESDELLDQERIEFSKLLTQKFNGKISAGGDVLRLLTYTQLQDSPHLFKEFKTSTYDFSIGRDSDLFASENMLERTLLYAKSLDELIEVGKEYDLKYIAINKEQPKNDWFGYLTNLYDEGEKYPFLTKVLDTKEIGFKKFKVKVFEINYDKFITNET